MYRHIFIFDVYTYIYIYLYGQPPMGYHPPTPHRMVCRGRRFAPRPPLWLWLEDLVNCLGMSCVFGM